MSGGASVNVPSSIPLIGGASIGSGNFLLDFSNDSNLSNDFGAGWGTINVQKLGLNLSFVTGFKAFFDGRIERIGAKSIPKTHSFIVDPGTKWLVMGADWENPNTNALFQVKAPNGSIFNESDFAANNIAIVDQLTDQNTKSVIVLNPTPGVWDIKPVNPAGLGNIEYSALRDSVTPTIQITDPATDVSGGNVAINYKAFDADSNAKISLFYDTDNQGFDSNTGVWDVGNMRDNLTRTLNISAQVNTPGSIITNATLLSLGENDINPTNNQTSLTINPIGSNSSNSVQKVPIVGTPGNDYLVGTFETDFIYGWAGNDILIGGLGQDILGGGPGFDTFVLPTKEATATPFLADTIVDFQLGVDRIGLTDGLTVSNLALIPLNNNTAIQIVKTNQILGVVAAVSPNQLTNSFVGWNLLWM